MTDAARFPDALPPAWVYSEGERGIGPAEFLTGRQWGAWNGRLLVAEMAAEELWLLRVAANGSVDGETLVSGARAGTPFEAGRYRALHEGPDGALYAAVEEAYNSGLGYIWRFAANATDAGAPGRRAGASPAAAPEPEEPAAPGAAAQPPAAGGAAPGGGAGGGVPAAGAAAPQGQAAAAPADGQSRAAPAGSGAAARVARWAAWIGATVAIAVL